MMKKCWCSSILIWAKMFWSVSTPLNIPRSSQTSQIIQHCMFRGWLHVRVKAGNIHIHLGWVQWWDSWLCQNGIHTGNCADKAVGKFCSFICSNITTHDGALESSSLILTTHQDITHSIFFMPLVSSTGMHHHHQCTAWQLGINFKGTKTQSWLTITGQLKERVSRGTKDGILATITRKVTDWGHIDIKIMWSSFSEQTRQCTARQSWLLLYAWPHYNEAVLQKANNHRNIVFTCLLAAEASPPPPVFFCSDSVPRWLTPFLTAVEPDWIILKEETYLASSSSRFTLE